MSVAAHRLRHLSQRPIYAADSSHCARPGLSLSIQTNWPPSGRSVHWAICTGKKEKNGVTSTAAWRDATGRCGGKTLVSEIPPLSYYGTFLRIVNLFSRSANLVHARINSRGQNERAPIVSPARFTKYRPLCDERKRISSQRIDLPITINNISYKRIFKSVLFKVDESKCKRDTSANISIVPCFDSAKSILCVARLLIWCNNGRSYLDRKYISLLFASRERMGRHSVWEPSHMISFVIDDFRRSFFSKDLQKPFSKTLILHK